MGKAIEPLQQIRQRSIGFKMRQHLFFNKYPDFKPDEFCRNAIDNQIEQIDKNYLNLTMDDIEIK